MYEYEILSLHFLLAWRGSVRYRPVPWPLLEGLQAAYPFGFRACADAVARQVRDWKKISVPFSSKVPGTFWPMSNTWTWPTSSSSRFSEGWMKPRLAGTWRARLSRWGGVELQPWRSLPAFRGREYSAGSENSRKTICLQRSAFAELVAVASARSSMTPS